MSQATGANSQVIYQAETQFGVTPATPDAQKLYILSESLNQKRNLNKTNVLRGNRNPVKPTRGNKDVSGSINTELDPYMGILLKHLFGSVVTTGAGANKTHTGKIGALPVGLTIEKGFLDLADPQYALINGCRINKGSFEFGPEGVVPFSLDYLGKKLTLSGTSFDPTVTDLGHLAWDMFEASIQEGGSAIAVVSNTKVDVENDLDGGMYVIGGGGERRAIPEGATLVSGTLTALFEDTALITKASGFTESSLKVSLVRGSGDGTAGNESFELFIPELVYGEAYPVISGPKGILVELPFSAFYDNSTEASAAQFILKNTQATL